MDLSPGDGDPFASWFWIQLFHYWAELQDSKHVWISILIWKKTSYNNFKTPYFTGFLCVVHRPITFTLREESCYIIMVQIVCVGAQNVNILYSRVCWSCSNTFLWKRNRLHFWNPATLLGVRKFRFPWLPLTLVPLCKLLVRTGENVYLNITEYLKLWLKCD